MAERIFVEREEIVHNLSEDENDLESQETETEHTLFGIRKVNNNTFYDLIVNFPIEFGKQYILLYAIYSAGDSFSTRVKGGIEFIDLFEDHQLKTVNENIELIQRDLENSDRFSLNLISHNGETYRFHMPWKGYFEELEQVNSKTVELLHDKT